MILDNWLSQRASTYPGRIAVMGEGRRLTYAQLEAEARALAGGLAAAGVGSGSEVAIRLKAGVDYAVVLHALMKIGAVAVPLDPGLTATERAAALGSAGGPEIATAEDLEELARPAGDEEGDGGGPPIDLAAPCCRILTSGSAGSPRPVTLTYGNHLWSAAGSAFNLGLHPEDRWLCCLPLHHVSGLSILLRSVIYGTTAIIQDGFDGERVARSLREDEVTLISVVPTMLERLLAADAELAGPRAVLVGGGPVPRDMLEEAIGRGATVVQTYGLTEAASQVTTLAPADARRKLGSAGRPLITARLRIDDGEILVTGPTVAPGCAGEDGWLRTDDAGHLDEEGFLWVEGRRDDVIVSGGENVNPAEVEQVLRSHPAVEDAAVVGRSDPEWQQAVAAVVVLRPGGQASPEELRRHCRESLAPFKVPKQIDFAAGLPRTAAGKLRRRDLVGSDR